MALVVGGGALDKTRGCIQDERGSEQKRFLKSVGHVARVDS